MTQDIRFALRQLRKNPGFTVTALLMLALGMCASVSIFAFVDAALIKPMPYRDPSQLVSVYETFKSCPRCNVSYLNFRDWKKSQTFFQSLDAWATSIYLLRTSTGSQPTFGTRVSDGFFRTLGVTPVLGRDFYDGEDSPGKPRTVLLTYSAWQNRFGGNRGIVGQSVTLSDISYTVIGVLPSDFHFAPRGSAEFWTPLNQPNSCEERRGCHNLFAIGRLKDGTSVQGALTGMDSIAQRMTQQYPATNRGFGADVVPLSEVVTGNIRPILLVLLSGAALLLLIACVNIASLLLVRSESRKREIAVRQALGASMSRIVRQFVTEGLLLVAAGSIIGLTLATWTMHVLTALIPANMLDGLPFLRDLTFNIRVLGFAALVGLLSAALFALTPILRFARSETREGLTEGTRGSAGMLWRRLGSKLVVVELATAVVLLVGAGLLGKSLYKLLHVETGFETDHLATLTITLPASYQTNEQVLDIERRMIGRMESIPGVRFAGVTTELPLRGWGMAANIVVVGQPRPGEQNPVPDRNSSAAYLKALGANLVRGRFYTEAEDDPAKPGKVIMNQAFATQYFKGQDPIGKQLAYEGSKDAMEIVGMVKDIKEGQLDTANRPAIYTPFSRGWFRTFNLVVRTTQDERSVISTLPAVIHSVDPTIGADSPISMSDMLRDSNSAYLHRSSAWMVGGFAALALILGVVGLYGVIAYSVSQRTREVGIRVALGADRAAVYRLILNEAAWLTASGVVIGLAGSIAAAALMRSLLFGVEAWDAPTLAVVAAVVAISALLASYIPARRAVSVNAAEALRADG